MHPYQWVAILYFEFKRHQNIGLKFDWSNQLQYFLPFEYQSLDCPLFK